MTAKLGENLRKISTLEATELSENLADFDEKKTKR